MASGNIGVNDLGSGAVVCGYIASGSIGNMSFGSGAILSGDVASGQLWKHKCEICKQDIEYKNIVEVHDQSWYPKRFCQGCVGFGNWENPFGRKGDCNFLVAADWLEEHGYKEAAVQLRKVAN